MEIGESPEETAAREVQEETGLVARAAGLAACHSRHLRAFANGDRIQGVVMLFQGQLDGGSLRPDTTGEIDANGWFDADGLPPLSPPWDDRVQRVVSEQPPSLD